MAVTPMFKVTVLAHRSVTDDIVAALQRSGVLEIDTSEHDIPTMEVAPDDPRLRAIDEQLADSGFVRDLLAPYHKAEQAFSAFVTEKFHVDLSTYATLGFDDSMRVLYAEAVGIADEQATSEREIARLRQLVHDLEPWARLDLRIDQWQCTPHTVLMTGTVPSSESATIRQRLRDATPLVTVEEVAGDRVRQAWLVIAHVSAVTEVRQTLASNGFLEVGFPELRDLPSAELQTAQSRIAELQERIERLHELLQRLSDAHYDGTVALVQALTSQRDRLMVRTDFGTTRSAVAVTGWVPQRCADELHAALAGWQDIDVTLAEPTLEDTPPVELSNPKWLKPLEVLTDLYGRPQYHELDPTIYLAPFFLAFFGICIGDVGYGAMLVVGAFLIKRYLDVTPGVKRFMDLLIYGGFAAMAFGVAFGSYLALPVDSLPAFLQSLQVIDPLAQLVPFLLFTCVLGVAQVFFGVFIAAYDAVRRGDVQEAIFGQLSTVFLFVALGVYAVTGATWLLAGGLLGTMLMQGRAIQAALGQPEKPLWDRVLGWAWLASAVYFVASFAVGGAGLATWAFIGLSVGGAIVSKTARSAVIATLGGAYAVYGMSGFVGDILSYTRLAALGLSGALVGMVFNLLAGLVWAPAGSLIASGGIGIVFGVLVAAFAAAVFVVGHVFNVVINLLGAFVHPARLQFVEFFGKFYEGGGRVFSPFRYRSDSLVLEAGAAGSEGGAE